MHRQLIKSDDIQILSTTPDDIPNNSILELRCEYLEKIVKMWFDAVSKHIPHFGGVSATSHRSEAHHMFVNAVCMPGLLVEAVPEVCGHLPTKIVLKQLGDGCRLGLQAEMILRLAPT